MYFQRKKAQQAATEAVEKDSDNPKRERGPDGKFIKTGAAQA